MNHKLKVILTKHFAGIKTDLSDIIDQAFLIQDPLTQSVIKHYASGGNGKIAPSLFFISESSYYRKVRNFVTVIETVALLNHRL